MTLTANRAGREKEMEWDVIAVVIDSGLVGLLYETFLRGGF